MVVPAVRVRAARRSRGHDGAGLVVLEAVARGRARVPRPVTARAGHRGVGRVGPGVARLRARVDPRGGIRPREGDRERVVVPAGMIGPARRARTRHRRRRRVVAEREDLDRRVPRPVTARTRHRSVRRVGPRVVLRRNARVQARGRIRAGEADRQRMVVPAVRIGSTRRSRRHDRAGRVVAEPERLSRRVPRSIRARAADRGVLVVGPGICLRRHARVDPRRRISSGEGDKERVVVPAVRVGRAARGRAHHRPRGVVAQREGVDRRVPGHVAAGPADGCVLRVGPGIGLRPDAGVHPRGRVRAGEADRQRVVVPAVRVRVA